MKRLILILICLLLFIIDNTLMPFFAIKGVYPSLLFTFAVLYALLSGYWEALFIGVLSGFLQDIYFVNVFGVNMLVNMLVCLIAAYIGESVFKHKKMIPILSVGLLTIIKFFAVALILRFINIRINLLSFWIMALYNVVIGFFMYNWIYRLCNRELMKRDWKISKK
ncbi:rod shape-determining protein MreD [Clostridium sp. LIBA-8841]|uniref:rod shape-determining protein MreD n=1 Tax=Clostridium sp. LIBA-8841 TaxID=2987530 RepID=UPI002AC3B965|nr:rod shape-determining protein MreD [Clostridium sp. LIBA-8841]MDZ5253091.1 rod shape-determining protein MreD [Clostridium sp. LIBA-8841]